MGLEEDAQIAYEKLIAKSSNFPNMFCKIAAIMMSWKGYKIIRGLVCLDNYCGSGKSLAFGIQKKGLFLHEAQEKP